MKGEPDVSKALLVEWGLSEAEWLWQEAVARGDYTSHERLLVWIDEMIFQIANAKETI